MMEIVSWDDDIPNMESHKIHVPKHQPDGNGGMGWLIIMGHCLIPGTNQRRHATGNRLSPPRGRWRSLLAPWRSLQGPPCFRCLLVDSREKWGHVSCGW